MRKSSFVRALIAALALTQGLAGAALAQTSTTPATKAGPPWYFWLGVAALGMAGIQVLQIAVMYVIQARGFNKVADRRSGGSSE